MIATHRHGLSLVCIWIGTRPKRRRELTCLQASTRRNFKFAHQLYETLSTWTNWTVKKVYRIVQQLCSTVFRHKWNPHTFVTILTRPTNNFKFTKWWSIKNICLNTPVVTWKDFTSIHIFLSKWALLYRNGVPGIRIII